MNSRMEDITFTARDGQTSQLQAVYIRGSKIRCAFCNAAAHLRCAAPSRHSSLPAWPWSCCARRTRPRVLTATPSFSQLSCAARHAEERAHVPKGVCLGSR